MARSIEHRLFSPRVLRRPFDLQKLQAKYPKVKALLSSLRNHNPEKVIPRTQKIKPALAYVTVAAFLEQTPTIQEAVRGDLEKQVLQPLKDKIDGQITRRQITAAGIALSSLLLLSGAAVYYIYYWGKTEEQARIVAFAGTIEEAYGKALKIEGQRTDLAEVDIESKLSGRVADFEPSSTALSHPDRLDHPRNFNISDRLAVDLSRFPTTEQVIAMVQRSARLELGSSSVWAADDRLSGPGHTIGSASADFSRREFTDFYRRVAKAPLVSFQDGRTFYSVTMQGVDFPLDDIAMDFLSLLFYKGNQAKEWYFLPDIKSFGEFYSSPIEAAAWRSAYSYIQHFGGDIDAAAGILARAHPGSLRENNLRVFLRDDLATQLLETTAEDPWQDRAACIKVGCSQLERLGSVYQEYSDKAGVEMWGKRRDLPWWAWWLASVTYKYDLEKQALGPAQVLVGLAGRAADRQEILGRYRPFLSQGDFSTSDDIVRTVLDPRKSIFTRAMVFDYIVTELERTLFSDPSFREPVTFAPLISDLRTAREYSLMYLASTLVMFPEFDFLAAKFLAMPHRPFYLTHLLHTADQFKIKLDLPGLLYYRWESPNAVIYSEFMF